MQPAFTPNCHPERNPKGDAFATLESLQVRAGHAHLVVLFPTALARAQLSAPQVHADWPGSDCHPQG